MTRGNKRQARKLQPQHKAQQQHTPIISVIGDCPIGTPCLLCHNTGDVKKCKDNRVIGGKAETLHEECALAYFNGRADN